MATTTEITIKRKTTTRVAIEIYKNVNSSDIQKVAKGILERHKKVFEELEKYWVRQWQTYSQTKQNVYD